MSSLIVSDVNLLIYAYDDKSSDFLASRRWWELALTSQQVGVPVHSILGFIRLTTHPNIPGERFTVAEAHAIVDSWLSRPNVTVLSPGPSHWTIFQRLSVEANARGTLSSDAHLAALAIEYDATLFSKDRDFARFPGLRWINPLANDV
jgi:uncharacterized protein